MAPFNPSRAKIQIKLAIQRTRLLAAKTESLSKKSRRDIATLLEKGKLETARIKAETLINSDIHVELLEVLELYCELLSARFGLLETIRECDPSIEEAVVGIVYAAPRTELPELHVLRDMLMAKYGREFSISVMENSESKVADRVLNKLKVETPPRALVDLYLYEIAKTYAINWKPEGMEAEEEEEARKQVEEKEKEKSEPQQVGERSGTANPPQPSPTSKVIPPPYTSLIRKPSSDIPQMPSAPPIPPEDAHRTVTIKTNQPGPSSPQPARTQQAPSGGGVARNADADFDALTKRFEALKKG